MFSKDKFLDTAIIFLAFIPHVILLASVLSGSDNVLGIASLKDILESSYYIAAITAVFIARKELNSWRVQKQFNDAEALLLELSERASSIKENHFTAKNLIDEFKEEIDNLPQSYDSEDDAYKIRIFLAISKLKLDKLFAEIPHLDVYGRYPISAKPEYKAIIDGLNKAIGDANMTIRLSNNLIFSAHLIGKNNAQENFCLTATELSNIIIPLDFEERYKNTEKIELAINEIETKKQNLFNSIYQHKM